MLDPFYKNGSVNSRRYYTAPENMTTVEESKTMETWYEEKCAYEYKMAELREENRVLRNQVDQLLRCVQTVEIIDSEGVKTGEGPGETLAPPKPLERVGATAGTDLPKCRYCGEMHDSDYYQPWEYCPCTFCGKRYSECLDSCVRHKIQDEKCTFCDKMESECGGDHSSEQRYIMQVHGGW
jgi:hypothetical protein